MSISAEQIKKLREETGISVMQCKEALTEAQGDSEKAIELLRKRGSSIAAKKADRELGSGTVASYVHNTKDIGVLITLLCETDFVAKNEEFVVLARDIAMHIAASNPVVVSSEDDPDVASEAVLLDQPFIKDQDKTVRDLIEAATQKFGEKIAVSQFVRFSVRG